ncbi:MAG TPA: nuclear transport factor 2 family protein [Rhodanobacter sp.]|nr:nuclear transport factor 2 family protein [Rhodanobacter sp.]
MKSLIMAMVILAIPMAAAAQESSSETSVRQTVQAFYAAFNSHGFSHAADFTTDDWNHINPYGGRTHGRAAVLKELHEVHGTFLNGVSDNIEKLDIRFASKDAAVATVTSRMSTFASPDGIKHINEQHIRTFVLARRGARWLIMQDQNTVVARPPMQ